MTIKSITHLPIPFWRDLAKLAAFLLLCLLSFSCTHREGRVSVSVPDELNGRIAPGAGGDLYLSKKRDDIFTIYRYAHDSLAALSSDDRDILNPFYVQGKVYGMTDGHGDENFTVNDPALQRKLGGKPLKYLFSSQASSCIVYGPVHSRKLYLYDLNSDKTFELLTYTGRVNGVDISGDHIAVSADQSLYHVNPSTHSVEKLADEMPGEKLNPSICGDEIYFVNNDTTEFYNIYKIAAKTAAAAVHCYGSDADLRLPDFQGGRLYFIEIRESKYLLSYIDGQQNKKHITRDGVVFSFNVKENEVLFTYSTINLPRSLCRYDLTTGTTTMSETGHAGTDLRATFVTRPGGSFYGYKIEPQQRMGAKGIILYVRGGGNGGDYSPRWDDILVNLVNHGYVVYAPNYVSSGGYGKSYTDQTKEQAVSDLLEWKKYITGKHRGERFYMLASSSGNLYMEELLKKDDEGIHAAASVVGLYAQKPSRNLLPMLYILGENDPRVDASRRTRGIWWRSWLMINKKVVVYKKEGHWLRRTGNVKDAVLNIIDFFEAH